MRPERYRFFQRLYDAGSLLASGQLLDDRLGDGMLIIEASSIGAANTVLDGDPYVQSGLVAQRIVTPWHPTIGTWVSH